MMDLAEPENPLASGIASKNRNIDTGLVAPFLVFVIAVLARVGYLIALKTSILFDVMVVDAALYDQWGLRIARGDWIGERVFYDPPLYAYFLGLLYRIIGHDYLIVRLAQILIGSAHCVVIYAIATRILNRRAGIIAGILAALYRPLIFYDAAIMKAFLDSTLSDLMLLVLMVAIEKRRRVWWFLGGVLLGLLSLLRVNMLAFAAIGVALFCYAFLRNRWFGSRAETAVSCASWLLGIVLVLLPVAVRNLAVSGQFIIVSSYMGQNFYTGNNPYNASGNYARIPFVRANPKYEEEDFRREAIQRTGRADLTPREISNFWMSESISYIMAEPWAALSRIATRFRIFWNSYEVPDTYNMDFEAKYFTPYLRLPFFNFGFIGPLGLVGMVLMWRERRRLWPLYCFLPVYMLTIIPFFVFDRYRLAATGSLIAFGGSAAMRGWELRPYLKRLLPACALFLALAALINYPLPHHVPDSEGFLNLGTLWREKGDLKKAEYYYRQSLAMNPYSWEAPYFLATVLREQGKYGEAVKAYAQSLGLRPRSADALAGIGICLDETGDNDNARKFYLQALEINKGLVDVRLRLIHLLLKMNEMSAAREQIIILRAIDPKNPEGIWLENHYGHPVVKENP